MKHSPFSPQTFLLSSKCYLVIGLFIFMPIISLQAFSNLDSIQRVYVSGVEKKVENNKIKIKTSDNISIIFSKIPDTLKYKYQCNGKDSNLVKEGEDRFVNYTDFPEGTFQFRMGNNQTEMNSQLIIEVSQDFLDSWGFIAIGISYILLIVLVAFYLLMISSKRSAKKLIDLRSDWTNKLHNDIGADLSSVSLRMNTLNKGLGKLDPVSKGRVEKVHTILTAIQNKLRFVFDLVDPKKNSLQVMLSEVAVFAKENFALQEVNFKFENGLEGEEMQSINIGRINKVYLVMKEAINNALKHSKAKNVSIKTYKIKEGYFFSIKDDGQGFDTSLQHAGNGLNNLLEYSREGFISVDIDSTPNQGTEVKIVVPKF